MLIRLAPVVPVEPAPAAAGLAGCVSWVEAAGLAGCGCGGRCGGCGSNAGVGGWVDDLFGTDSFGKATFDISIGALAGFGLLVLISIPFFSPAATARRRRVSAARRDLDSAKRKLSEAKKMRRL